MSNKVVAVKGEIFYAIDMVQFNQYTEDKQQYLAKICNLDDDTVAELREMGIHISNNANMGNYITCKSKFTHKPVDSNGIEVDPKIIGNGSKCTALIGTYNWSFGRKTGVGATAKRIEVTDLIKYEPPVMAEAA